MYMFVLCDPLRVHVMCPINLTLQVMLYNFVHSVFLVLHHPVASINYLQQLIYYPFIFLNFNLIFQVSNSFSVLKKENLR